MVVDDIVFVVIMCCVSEQVARQIGDYSGEHNKLLHRLWTESRREWTDTFRREVGRVQAIRVHVGLGTIDSEWYFLNLESL